MKKNPLSGQLKITITSVTTSTRKRLSPEAVQTGRRQELKFVHRLPLLKEVSVEQCWLETNSKPIGTKWIDINKGDGDPVEIRPSLVAREREGHQVKMGISRDDVFRAATPFEAVGLLMILKASQVIQTRVR